MKSSIPWGSSGSLTGLADADPPSLSLPFELSVFDLRTWAGPPRQLRGFGTLKAGPSKILFVGSCWK